MLPNVCPLSRALVSFGAPQSRVNWNFRTAGKLEMAGAVGSRMALGGAIGRTSGEELILRRVVTGTSWHRGERHKGSPGASGIRHLRRNGTHVPPVQQVSASDPRRAGRRLKCLAPPPHGLPPSASP
jgi:hypothetical protein